MRTPTQTNRNRSQRHIPDPAFEYFWLAYQKGFRNGRDRLSHLRDGAAFVEISIALTERGGRYGSAIRNGPASRQEYLRNRAAVRGMIAPRVEDIIAYHPVDDSFLGPNQMLVVITRLPMDDLSQGGRVSVPPTFTSLEQAGIRNCRIYVEACSRSRVRLARPVADQLNEAHADRADILYKSYKTNPRYSRLCAASPDAKRHSAPRGDRTAAYLLRLPNVTALHGAELLLVWGMNGPLTLGFAHRLRTDLSYLLDYYGLSMVEIEPGSAAFEDREGWNLLDYARDWHVTPLLEGVYIDPRTGRACRQVPARSARSLHRVDAESTQSPRGRRARRASRVSHAGVGD